jgi:hypothetical protein
MGITRDTSMDQNVIPHGILSEEIRYIIQNDS